MRTPARPRLPDGDCVFISGARIVARADVPFIAADMTWLGLTPPLIINRAYPSDASLRILPSRFRNFKTIRLSKLSENKLSVCFFIKCKKVPL